MPVWLEDREGRRRRQDMCLKSIGEMSSLKWIVGMLAFPMRE